MDPAELNRFAGQTLVDVPNLAQRLVRGGKLTAYQAGAISQRKAKGLVIGKYLILEKLGAGGMGVVFKARHQRLGRVVALKILPPSLGRDHELLGRFRREVEVTARLCHPNIVAALDADEDRGVHFLTVEYIEGHNLHDLVLQNGPLALDQALHCVIQAAQGLEAAHVQGVVHRDIKPGNLMLDASGTIRVLDLGLARLVDMAASNETDPNALTRSGTSMGTAAFMAPEQARDSRLADHRADIYSLGCSFYFLLTGRPPFEGKSVMGQMLAHSREPVPSLRAARPEVPDSLDFVYQRMMAKDPADRPVTMTAVIERLEACRFSVDEADQARSGLLTISQTVMSRDLSRREPQESLLFVPIGELAWAGQVDALSNDSPGISATSSADSSRARPVRPPTKSTATALALAIFLALGVIATVYILWYVPRSTPALALADPRGEVVEESPSSIPVETESIVETASDTSARSSLPNPEPTPAPAPSAVSVPAKVAPASKFTSAPRFRRHSAALKAIAVSSDGRLALSADVGGVARLWEVATGRQQLQMEHPAMVLDVAISPDSKFALTGSRGSTEKSGLMRLWNLNTGRLAQGRLEAGHSGAVRAVAFLSESRAVSGGVDGRLILWDLRSGRPLRTYGPQGGPIHARALAVFPDGRHVASGGGDKVVHIRDLDTGQESGRWEEHPTLISSVAVSHDGRRVASGGAGGLVILWDVISGTPIQRFHMPAGEHGPSLAILPSGNVLAAGSSIGHLVEWDAVSGALVRQADGPRIPHSALAVLPDGRRVLTADQDNVVRIWTQQ
jgi:serine/threonine protein kinase